MVIEFAPLEDELGDVLDKAMRCTGLTEVALAAAAGVDVERVREAMDYRSELTVAEVGRLAAVLRLNEVGVQALAAGCYPLPQICGLPMCLYPLRMRHGIGVVNAFIVADCCAQTGILFDTGVDAALLKECWPKSIKRIEAVFVTHGDTEHAGGLRGVIEGLEGAAVFYPQGMAEPCARAVAVGEGCVLNFGPFRVRVLSTPGHAEAHNCYLVDAPKMPAAAALLVSGDMLFAGSVGGAYSCPDSMGNQLGRLFSELEPGTIVAPGHGPLTTVGHERRYNPFSRGSGAERQVRGQRL